MGSSHALNLSGVLHCLGEAEWGVGDLGSVGLLAQSKWERK